MPRALARTALAAGALAAAAGAEWRGRRRAAAAAAVARRQALASVPAPPSAAERSEEALVALLHESADPAPRRVGTPVTDRTHARLAPGDVAAVEAVLAEDALLLHEAADAETRRRLVLNFAALYGLDDVLGRAGISAAMPPDDVHAMARGPVAAGGDWFTADLVFDALEHAGLPVAEGARVLDFGASSGRVLRAIAAGRPDLACSGCDPNAAATAWAQEHLPMARFFTSPQRPPLPLRDGTVDMAFAISIWSHFAEGPATAWLAELHRVLAPGGALVLTTHGPAALPVLLRRGAISRGTAAEAAAALLQARHHFVDVFGPDGDWGVQDPEWGNAYFGLDWLAREAGEQWTLRLVWPGQLDGVQDVVVLQRR